MHCLSRICYPRAGNQIGLAWTLPASLNSIVRSKSRVTLPPMAMPIVNAPAMMPIKAGPDIHDPSRAVIRVVVVAVGRASGMTVAVVSDGERKAKSDPN